MKAVFIGMASVAILIPACATVPIAVDAVSWSDVASKPEQFRDKQVKVCGLATRAFEDVQITEFRGWNWWKRSAGLGVDWLDAEPRTDTPVSRCVSGYIEPMCGWDEYRNTDLICLSTGASYEWKIRQTSLARD